LQDRAAINQKEIIMQKSLFSTQAVKSHGLKLAAGTLAATLLLAACVDSAAAAQRSPITCLKVRSVSGTNVVDENTIDFHMRDGSTYRNSLARPCGGAIFSAFVHHSATDVFCDHEVITVVQPQQHCMLGTFKKLPG
jgi:hypothetical protein